MKEKFQSLSEEESYLIKHLYQDIFNGGKSLALLRICDPNNFLCNNKDFYPKLIVNFNQSYLTRVDSICSDYSKLVVEKSKYKLKTRKEFIEEQDKEAQEVLSKMQFEAAEKFKRYQEQENEERKLEAERKRQKFIAAKDLMELDVKRRADEKEKQKKEDKEYMEKLLNRDFELTDKQKQLERELKEEITKEYEEKIKKSKNVRQ